MGQKPDPNYFKFPKPVEGTIIACLMIIFGLTLYNPENVLFDYLGPFGAFCQSLNKEYMGVLKIILYCTIVIHAGEAICARSLCIRKGINSSTTFKWMVQTFIMGFPSLLQLTAYHPDRKSV